MAEGMVHVIDDDASVLRGVSWLLESAGFSVATYPSGDEFLGRYQDGAVPECVVLDLRMPGLSGLEVQALLAERGWAVPIIFLTAHGQVADAVTAIQRGAFDFLEKPFADDALLERVKAALERDRERRRAASVQADVAARIGSLTKREHQVALRVAAGLPNKVIAEELGISARTVEVYRAKAMSKTGAGSVAELVRLVVRQENPS
jgi:FixJ family two-component response regulator